ncbi:flagellar hook-basal body complex protein FliE [Thiomicrospira sp. WB1]|jgi:flagellar hook-basal body complex protein FliE|uniref:flagellar hook-basal body complex protein FliE n=1 Tax=Thiomicrospira sp. WB1 TaxID=1685380 RepID=UPI0007486CBD|nr:flagellar hook-basal body complex protein FliE [Thiomicrospira sp. WB1]KUJ71640.1 flagellar hook-basal body protein FliE [Thiomicrospira sp. WB1]
MTNSVDTQSLMLQMRSLAAEAASQNKPTQVAAEPTKGIEAAESFSDLMNQSINAVARESNKSGDMKKAFERGEDIELTEVMLQAQKASLSFEAMKEVRNKLVEAYKDIKNMPI